MTPQERKEAWVTAKEVKTQGKICIIYGFSCFIIAALLKFMFLPMAGEMGNAVPITVMVIGVVSGVVGSVLFHVYESLVADLAKGQDQDRQKSGTK